ncbi:uncharacterized protein JCM15063_002421 [Sporobolomyces koalae]|uniref:uncharacterized protein n=1 Tax=Sporobolomyces koalae TaxID=500713 RepID=UPI0031787811
MTISNTSFLKARPSRILKLLKILQGKWPDGPESASWKGWRSDAIDFLQRYVIALAHSEGVFDEKSFLTKKHVFPAKEFHELETALKELVEKDYKAVEEVVSKHLDLVRTALVEVKYPAEWTTRQYTDVLQETGWEVFHWDLDAALVSEKEALLKMQHSDSRVERVLGGLLKDLIKLEYYIVADHLAPAEAWEQFKHDWLTADGQKQPPQYQPSKYKYPYLTGALRGKFQTLPELEVSPLCFSHEP